MASIQVFNERFDNVTIGDTVTSSNSRIDSSSGVGVAGRAGQGTAARFGTLNAGGTFGNIMRHAGVGKYAADFMFSTYPTANNVFLRWYAGSAGYSWVSITPTGGLVAWYNTDVTIAPAGAIAPGQWFRFEIMWNQGRHELRVWLDPDSTGTPDYQLTRTTALPTRLVNQIHHLNGVTVDNIVTHISDDLPKYQGGRTVAIIGDSLTEYAAYDTLVNLIAANGFDRRDIYWNAVGSRKMEPLTDPRGLNTDLCIDGAKMSLASDPVWVLALGTNDALMFWGGGQATFRAVLDHALDKIGSGQTILIPTVVHNGNSNNGVNPNPSFDEFNDEIRAAKIRHGDKHIRVLEWATYAKAQLPSIFSDPVHNNINNGQVIRSTFIAHAIGAPGKWDAVGPEALGVWNGSAIDPATLLGVWEGAAVEPAHILGVK